MPTATARPPLAHVLAAWLVVAFVAAAPLLALEVRVRDLAAVLFPAVFAGVFAHGLRRGERPAPGATAGAARWIGAAGVAVCALLFCRPQAWGFAGTIDSGGVEPFDLAVTLVSIGLYGGRALQVGLGELRDPARLYRALVALFPLWVLPGIAIVHALGSRTLPAALALVWVLGLSAALLRAARRQSRPRLALAAALLVPLALAARFSNWPHFDRVADSVVGLPHRYGYMMATGGSMGEFGQELYKYDLESGASTTYTFAPGCMAGEPVPAVGRGGSEDDGWLLTFVYDAARDQSDLAILDATNLEKGPVARVHLPCRVPAGFHGSWIPDEE